VSGVRAAHDAERVIQVFARAPVPGQAKTRLIPALGACGAARLHARMAEHVLARASEAARALGADLQLWSTGQDPRRWLAAQARQAGATLRTQPTGDLGERMLAATSSALARGARVVLVGTDCPARGAEDFIEAFAALEAGHDVVLQPTLDGGYALIGLATTEPALFHGIDWGAATVLEATRERIATCGLRLACLTATWDVDRPDDLARVAALGAGWPAALRRDASGP